MQFIQFDKPTSKRRRFLKKQAFQDFDQDREFAKENSSTAFGICSSYGN